MMLVIMRIIMRIIYEAAEHFGPRRGWLLSRRQGLLEKTEHAAFCPETVLFRNLATRQG